MLRSVGESRSPLLWQH